MYVYIYIQNLGFNPQIVPNIGHKLQDLGGTSLWKLLQIQVNKLLIIPPVGKTNGETTSGPRTSRLCKIDMYMNRSL